jgi:SH3-like domain-containing protein
MSYRYLAYGFRNLPFFDVKSFPGAHRLVRNRRSHCAGGAILTLALLLGSDVFAQEPARGTKSRLEVPRFVSLKPDRVNVRSGPARDHEVTWIYTRSGLPVEITAESENWRRIRDWEGSEGWVYHSMLSGRRTGVVKAKEPNSLVPLLARGDATADVVAQLQSGVLGWVKRCADGWCRFTGQGASGAAGQSFDGFIAQERLWGVYPNEKVE